MGNERDYLTVAITQRAVFNQTNDAQMCSLSQFDAGLGQTRRISSIDQTPDCFLIN